MTVADLILELKECNPIDIVVIAKDGEGNSFSPLSETDNTMAYYPENTYSGEVGLRQLTKKHIIDGGYTEDDIAPEGSEDCVILWPEE